MTVRCTDDSSDALRSDDSNIFDFFPSSPSSHRFTSPPLAECQAVTVFIDDLNLVVPKRRTLPLELIEYIIKLFHQRYRSFRALRALSEASSQFRVIALRRYMTSLNIYSAKQLTSLSKMHICMLSRNPTWDCVGLHWVKHLTAQSGDLAKAPWRPSLMGSLRTLHISFGAEVRSTQKIRSKQIFVIPLTNSPMIHLTSLTLTELWRIDVLLLSMLSGAFPGLMSLHLSCSEHLDVSCCWTCFEDSSLAVVHSPIPNHFPTVASLTSAFAKALKQLTKLTDLHLGIFLSDEEMLNNHIDHYDSPRVYSRILRTTFGQDRDLTRAGLVLSQSESPSTASLGHVSFTEDEEDVDNSKAAASMTFDEVPPFPHGPELCPICSIVVSAPDVRTRELEASLALAQKLKSLKTISWSSFFAWKLPSDDERRIGDWQRATKVYALRSGGRVRVRRRPWD
ncbi:hypothetical protein J3R82DRAFT_8459 [Butyriboletus roseoflavus]|nr:hypothetical protein J3R82DRAFT_8459 [Butyriboletus roseoflavus]